MADPSWFAGAARLGASGPCARDAIQGRDALRLCQLRPAVGLVDLGHQFRVHSIRCRLGTPGGEYRGIARIKQGADRRLVMRQAQPFQNT